MTVLDQALVEKTKRRPPKGALNDDECVAINLFWRKQVRVPILARVFNVSKNTIYYRCLTGAADSYPTSEKFNTAKKTNATIEGMGVEAAWKKYVTDQMIADVNEAMAAEVQRRAA
jgi:hypothetical protein